MKEYAYSTLDIAWIIDGMTLGCRREYQVCLLYTSFIVIVMLFCIMLM